MELKYNINKETAFKYDKRQMFPLLCRCSEKWLTINNFPTIYVVDELKKKKVYFKNFLCLLKSFTKKA